MAELWEARMLRKCQTAGLVVSLICLISSSNSEFSVETIIAHLSPIQNFLKEFKENGTYEGALFRLQKLEGFVNLLLNYSNFDFLVFTEKFRQSNCENI